MFLFSCRHRGGDRGLIFHLAGAQNTSTPPFIDVCVIDQSLIDAIFLDHDTGDLVINADDEVKLLQIANLADVPSTMTADIETDDTRHFNRKRASLLAHRATLVDAGTFARNILPPNPGEKNA